MRKNIRAKMKQAFEMLDLPLKGLISFILVQVSDVLADGGKAVSGNADGTFLLRSQCQNLISRFQGNRQRRVPAPAPDKHLMR